MSHPLISVVIPTFNRASSIAASVASVQHQTFRDFEIIVVDDGSTDDTEQILRDLALPQLRYIRHPENLGANAARNTGIEAALGTFIAFQDSDDSWHPEKLSRQIQACRHFDSDVAFCAFNRIIDGKKTVIPKPGYNIKPGCHKVHGELLRGSFISCQTLLLTKAALLRVGAFEAELPRLQDWELCLRLSKHYDFAFVDETLVDTEVGPDSITSGRTNYARAADIILKKHSEDFEKDKIAATMLCLNVAVDAFRKHNYSSCLNFIWRALVYGKLGFPTSVTILFKRR